MSDPTTPEGRAELCDALRGLAVARPWHVEEMPETQEGRVYSLEVDGMPWAVADRIEVNDARLIVAAVNALPALLDALDKTQEELRRVAVERDGQYDRRRIAEFERDRAKESLDRVRELADELEASPKVGATGEEQWELDTRRVVGRELREALDGEQ